MTKKSSTNQIQKTLNLAQEFDNYMVKHRDFLNEIGKSPTIIIGDANDTKFTTKNLELGKKIAREEHKKVYQVIRMKKGWRIINVLDKTYD